MAERSLKVNGQKRVVDAPDDMPLLWVLRDRLGVTGPKYGCGIAMCGACTVHVGGEAVRSCLYPLAAVGDREVLTIEGVSQGGAGRVGREVEKAWTAAGVAQCGYCQPGQIMSATRLLQQKPKPTDADIDAAMTGNLCRCATYVRIRAAVKAAAAALQA